MTKDRLNGIISGLDWDILTPWEEDFIENAEEYFKKHGDLPRRQENTLEKIYQRKSR